MFREDVPRCMNCGVEITWSPVIMPAPMPKPGPPDSHREQINPAIYCCESCQQGLGCNCAVRMDVIFT